MPTETNGAADKQLTMKVVSHIQKLIETGALKAGNKIPPEREFAAQLKISRASLRTGIGYLAAMGVLKVRHGVGTFVAEEARAVDSFSMRLLSAFNGFKPKQMVEARLVLEPVPRTRNGRKRASVKGSATAAGERKPRQH